MSQYSHDHKLGSGGFGDVWKVIRIKDNEAFAKKILIDESPEAIKRFQREVRILSKLDHPRIVGIIDAQLDEPPLWYVMPLYDNSLRDILRTIIGNESRIPKIFTGILEGMHYAHAQGVIHRDLKPENIVLEADDNVVISDFGLGRAIDAKTTRATYTGQPLGTFGYLAPEQTNQAKSADHRSDIFSLGRILYEMYTGDSMNAIQDLSLLPVGIAPIVERCTKTDPEKRFQSVDELRTAFTSIIAARTQKAPDGKLKALIAQAVTQGTLTEEGANELAHLVAQAQDDKDLLHEICMELPAPALKTLWKVNPVITKILIKAFADQVVGHSWPYDYTDRIGEACVRIHDASQDYEVRGIMIAAALEVGVSHNRWHVMDVTAELLAKKRTPGEGQAIAYVLYDHRGNLKVIEERLDLKKLDPAIRDLFREGT